MVMLKVNLIFFTTNVIKPILKITNRKIIIIIIIKQNYYYFTAALQLI